VGCNAYYRKIRIIPEDRKFLQKQNMDNSVPRFPPPPNIYKTFLSEEDIKREPPKPPSDEAEIFNVFGNSWVLEAEMELPAGIKYQTLFKEDFKLLRISMRKVLETLGSNVKEGYMKDVESVNSIFLKIQTRLKSFRYHEARANIVTHLERQIHRKETSIKELNKVILDIKQNIANCLEE
jgi:hypothetical protein